MAGFHEKIVRDNRVYPVRPTPGVNRGYVEGILDDSLRLVKFTAASGPVLYRGDLFGEDYHQNAFVPEPSANLIKRNILKEKGYRVQGAQAYEGKEFLSSSDERFRPVSSYNGPDGALYIVDMYRGIIQHKTYLTQYLKNEIKTRGLNQPTTYGRIYKIVPLNKTAELVTLPNSPDQLIQLLRHSNGWVRDRAQQMLVDGKFLQVVPALRKFLLQVNDTLTVIHALWTLEGLGALQSEDILPLLNQSSWPIRMQALSVLPSVMNSKTYRRYLPVLEQILKQKDTLAAPYLAFIAQTIQSFDKIFTDRLIHTVTRQYPENVYVSDAAISILKDREAAFLKQVVALNPDTNLAINKRLRRVLDNIKNMKNRNNAKNLEKQFPRGAAIFKSNCQSCHGVDGNGIKSLAPPLNNSEWVTGDGSKLLSIVLYGLTGPIKVSGTLYEAPEINGDMPGIGNNNELSDEDIAQLTSFIRNSWNNKAEKISKEDVNQVREKFKGRQKAFTMEELKKLK